MAALDLAPLLALLLVVVGGAALFRGLAARLGQPGVVGELLLGLALGASLLGWAWPGAHAALLPPSQRPVLEALGWVGVVLFMFHVGSEMRWDRARSRGTLGVAAGGIALPLALGMGLAAASPGWFFDGAPGPGHLVVVGVALAVSALPVLGRVLEDLGLLRSPLGAVALGAATVDDLLAWGLLALVVGAGSAGLTGSPAADVLVAAAVLGAAWAADRALGGWLAKRPALPAQAVFAALLAAVLGAALLTHVTGLHAVLGPFAVGAIVSRHEGLLRYARPRFEGLTSLLFLPAFFLLLGLDANLTLLASGAGLAALAGVLLVASVGKVAGCAAGGALAGLPAREGAAAGILLNARGAVGLVVAKVGLDAGLLAPRGFALLVAVVLLTTILAPVAFHGFARGSGQGLAPRRGRAPTPEPLPTAAEALAMTVRPEEGAGTPGATAAPRAAVGAGAERKP